MPGEVLQYIATFLSGNTDSSTLTWRLFLDSPDLMD
jgi:hypothetical protein